LPQQWKESIIVPIYKRVIKLTVVSTVNETSGPLKVGNPLTK